MPYTLKLTIFHAFEPLCTINKTIPKNDNMAALRCETELNTSSVACFDPSRESSRVSFVAAKDHEGGDD